METRYLYFNKRTFRHLVNLWLKLGCGHISDRFSSKEEYVDWLMRNFIPDKFIDDIERITTK